MFTRSLAEIIPPEKGIVAAVHPGIVRTNIMRNSSPNQLIFDILSVFTYLCTKSCVDAVQSILFIIYSDPKTIKSGAYYAECALSSPNPLVEV